MADIGKEIDDLEKQFHQDQMSVKDAENDYNRAVSEEEKVENEADDAYTQYVRNTEQLYNGVKQLKDKVKSSKQMLKEADPERAAAEVVDNGGAISIGKALELIETEKEAKRKHKENESQYFKAVMEYAGEAAASGLSVAWELGGESLSGMVDAVFSKEGALTLAGGVVAGASVGPIDTIVNAVQGYVTLTSEEETEGEEKFIEGMENEDEYQNYIASNAGGEGYNAYESENGEGGVTDEEKEVTEFDDEGKTETVTENALDVDDFEDFTPDNYFKDDKEDEDEQTNGLQSSVHEADTPEPDQQPEGDEIPDVPDVPDVPDDDFDFGLG